MEQSLLEVLVMCGRGRGFASIIEYNCFLNLCNMVIFGIVLHCILQANLIYRDICWNLWTQFLHFGVKIWSDANTDCHGCFDILKCCEEIVVIIAFVICFCSAIKNKTIRIISVELCEGIDYSWWGSFFPKRRGLYSLFNFKLHIALFLLPRMVQAYGFTSSKYRGKDLK